MRTTSIDARYIRHVTGTRNPTIWLLAADLALLAGGVAAHAAGLISLATAAVASTIGLYCIYTVTHEAVHGNIHPNRRLNDWLGRIAAALQGLTFPMFRIVHLQHHAYTNDPVRDPDYIIGRQPRWLLPIWTIVRLANDNIFMTRRQLWSGQRRQLVEHLLTVSVQIFAIVAAWATGLLREFFWLWLAPAFVAAAVLELTVAWAVHYPHESRDPRENTRMFRGVHWQILTLNQNYHLVHHLWTRVPWFRYGQLVHLAESVAADRTPPAAPSNRA